MSRNSYGPLIIFLGMGFMFVRIVIHNQMHRVVAKLAPPKTNRPLKNLFESLSTSRVRREYQRLFPKRAKRKFLLSRITTAIGISLILIGIFVAR
jgi:hypothetical protein